MNLSLSLSTRFKRIVRRGYAQDETRPAQHFSAEHRSLSYRHIHLAQVNADIL